eukprot:1177608-Prorocentrum_minimum.AAC.1
MDVRIVRLGHPARLLESLVDFSLDVQVERSDSKELANDARAEVDAILKRLQTKCDKADKYRLRGDLKELRKETLRGGSGRAQRSGSRGALHLALYCPHPTLRPLPSAHDTKWGSGRARRSGSRGGAPPRPLLSTPYLPHKILRGGSGQARRSGGRARAIFRYTCRLSRVPFATRGSLRLGEAAGAAGDCLQPSDETPPFTSWGAGGKAAGAAGDRLQPSDETPLLTSWGAGEAAGAAGDHLQPSDETPPFTSWGAGGEAAGAAGDRLQPSDETPLLTSWGAGKAAGAAGDRLQPSDETP